jgi:hypothetical protein
MDKDVVLTTREAMKYIHLGRIKAVKAGHGWRVHQSELYRFLKVEEREEIA